VIDGGVPVFPNNVIELIAIRAGLIDDDLRILKRPLRPTDPRQSVGVFPSTWNPVEDSYEMKGRIAGASEPLMGRYNVSVQAFVRDFDETRGLAVHSVLSKRLRSMLYRDASLAVSLRALAVVMNGSTERTQRYGVGTVRYISSEIDEDFLYLSTLEFWIETETI
jgi:hypothetical protein